MRTSKKKKTVHLMRGLPGSGKSTKSNALLVANNGGGPMSIVRLNRDGLRKMLWPSATWRPEFEDVVKMLEREMAQYLVIGLGLDVVIDDTNLGDDELAVSAKFAQTVIHDFRDVDVETCLLRNEERRAAGGNFCSPNVIVHLVRRHKLI